MGRLYQVFEAVRSLWGGRFWLEWLVPEVGLPTTGFEGLGFEGFGFEGFGFEGLGFEGLGFRVQG